MEILTHADNRIILQQLIPEAVMTCYQDESTLRAAIESCLGRADAVVLGCGLGTSDLSAYCVAEVLAKVVVPLVVDADALNIISQSPALLQNLNTEQKARTVMTPHPAEAARLLGDGASVASVVSDLVTAANALCDKYAVNVLLKDAHTLVRSNDGQSTFINLSGTTALATAGSGDVLAGLIGGLMAAQTNELPVATTAALAAFLHGKAGEKAEEAVGARAAMARDILAGLTK